MTGTLINVAAIVVGGVVGLTTAKDLSPGTQARVKLVLGLLVAYVGLSMTWQGLNGSLWNHAKQFCIIIAALMLGRWTGAKLQLQRRLNALGQSAKERFARGGGGASDRVGEGFVTCTLLFCVGPMSILGALQDGLLGDYKTLALKSAMDGLATMAFSKVFGWGVLLAAIPVLAYQGTITILAKAAERWLQQPALLDAFSATGGMLVFCIALVVLDIKRVQLADYLPSLIYAPALAWALL
jgi:hypothetical protein